MNNEVTEVKLTANEKASAIRKELEQLREDLGLLKQRQTEGLSDQAESRANLAAPGES